MIEQLRNFFIEARSEFKKISWPSPDEIRGSTAVVFVTIGFLLLLLFVYDYIIGLLMKVVIK